MRAFKNIDTGNVFKVREEEGARISLLSYMQEGYIDNKGEFHAIAKSLEDELKAKIKSRDEDIEILNAEIRKHVETIKRLNEEKLVAIKNGDTESVKDIEHDIAVTQESLVVADRKKRAVK